MTPRWAVMLVVLMGACRQTRGPEPRPSSEQAASPPVASASSNAVPSPSGIPLARWVSPALADPRLGEVRAREAVRDYSGAVRLLSEARTKGSLGSREACQWAYLEGRYRALAGDWQGAHGAWEAAEKLSADSDCSLGAHASIRGARALHRLGRYDEAIARAASIVEPSTLADEAALLRAESLLAKGDAKAAVPLLRAVLSARGDAARSDEVTLRLGLAIWEASQKSAADPSVREALDHLTQGSLRSPKLADRLGVGDVRRRAADVLGVRGGWAPDQKASLAEAYWDAHDQRSALSLSREVLRDPDASSRAKCRASITEAQALGRKARGAWDRAVGLCQKEDAEVQALYGAARAATQESRLADAQAHYDALESRYPSHRLSDDARLQAALVARSAGDLRTFESKLESLPDRYPDGDQKHEATFVLAFHHLQAGRLREAARVLDKGLAHAATDRHWARAGRIAHFRGRVAELEGDHTQAKQAYAGVVADHPLSFYMLLSMTRLRALDPAHAEAALRDAMQRDRNSSVDVGLAALSAPSVRRGVSLLEVGDTDAGKRELSSILLPGSPRSWLLGVLLNQAGHPELGHSFAQNQRSELFAHYPVGPYRVGWEAAFPRAYEAIVNSRGQTTSSLVYAIMREESAFRRDARSPVGALGLMQIMPATGELLERGTPYATKDKRERERNLLEPEISITLGSKYLARLEEDFPGAKLLAIPAYNAGPGKVRKWLRTLGEVDIEVFAESIPYDETRGYLKRVLASQAAYVFLERPRLVETQPPIPLRVGPQNIR